MARTENPGDAQRIRATQDLNAGYTAAVDKAELTEPAELCPENEEWVHDAG